MPQPLSLDYLTLQVTPRTPWWYPISTLICQSRHYHTISYISQLARILGVAIQDVGVDTCPKSSRGCQDCTGGWWSRAELGKGFTVLDAKTRAVVGPKVEVRGGCGCPSHQTPAHHSTCQSNTCLNGGRCVPVSTGIRWVNLWLFHT